MNVAFLFDADGALYNGNYYWHIRRLIFKSEIIQSSGRHMKMSVGDVILHTNNIDRNKIDEIIDAVFFYHNWGSIQKHRLARTFGRSEIFAVVFDNMTLQTADELDRFLLTDERYLGAKEVSYDYGPHLFAYRLHLSTVYRLQGDSCRIFISMNMDELKDEFELQELLELGFIDVDWEDDGARKTIFDDYDTLEHFLRIGEFRKGVAPLLPGKDDDACELVMVLEDLNPRLFNSLSAAIVSALKAEHEEHVAQAAVSGRRYMIALADALFPPREGLVNNRKVGRAEFKNRLWAFIQANVPDGDERLTALGTEVNRLVDELCGGVHEEEREKERVIQALADAAKLTSALAALNPAAARQPYLAYQKSLASLLK